MAIYSMPFVSCKEGPYCCGVLCLLHSIALFMLVTSLTACQSVFPSRLNVILEDPFATRELTSDSAAQVWSPSPINVSCAPFNGKSLSLEEVINQTLCNNPHTREVWASARVQAAQVGVSQAAYLPNLDGSVSFIRSGIDSAGLNTLSDTQLDSTLSLNYLLFDFGGRSATLESALQSLIAANWTHNAILQNVILAAVQGYYQLFATQAAVEATKESEKSSLESLNAATFRHEIGAAALADKLQAQTAYSQAKLNRERAEGEAHIAQGGLANTLGLDADHPLRLAPPSLQEPVEHLEQNVRGLIESAKKTRPELAAAKAQVKAAQAGVRVARASGLPSLSLVGSYGYDHSNMLPDTSTYNIGLSLNFPLFSGFATTYLIQAAQQQVDVETARRDTLRNQVALDVWSAYQNLNTAKENLSSSADLLASATQSEQVALGRYKAGAGSILDLLNAQANLANARLQRIQAQYSWFIIKAILAHALGELEVSTISEGQQDPLSKPADQDH
jgi:Outer membrane protein